VHITDLFFRGYRMVPDRLALSGDGGDFTYRETFAFTNRIGRRLRDDGFGPGDRFAVLSPNTGRAFIAMLGGMRAGVAWCNLNMKAAVPDILHILAAGRCNLLFFHESAAHMIDEIVRRCRRCATVVCIGGSDLRHPSLEHWLGEVSRCAARLSRARDQPGLPGRNGRHHRPLQAHRCIQPLHADRRDGLGDLPALRRAAREPGRGADHPRRRVRGAGHGSVRRHDHHDVDPDVGEMIDADRAAPRHHAVPAAHADLHAAGASQAATADFSSLRYLIAAASPFAPEKIVEAVQRLGPVVCQAFGQTESGFPTTFMSPAEMATAVHDPALRHRLVSCGRPTVIVEAMEIMDEDGRLLAAGESGEVVLRGPTMMDCYLDDDAATVEIQKFGWHHTGDIGRRDEDGYFYITDRKRDLIISGGFNIFPFEVESALMKHPACRTAR
jgi:fatty-acyl-CoA synthase